MVKIKAKTKVSSAKKKFPIKIESSSYFNKVILSESKVSDLDEVIGNRLFVTLAFLTKNIKHQNVRVSFRVTEVNTGVAKTEICLYKIVPYYLMRLLKKGSPLIEDSFKVKTKDDRTIVVKPFVTLKNYVSVSKEQIVRKTIKEYFIKYASTNTSEEIFKATLQGTLMSSLISEVRKFVPIKHLDFKKLELEK